MTIEIGRVELQLHIAEALAEHGIGVEAFEVRADREGGWCIQLLDEDSDVDKLPQARTVRQIERELGRRYKIHRLSLGGAYGG